MTHYWDKEEKKFLPLVVSVFILSVFTGILITLIVRQWMISNKEVIRKIQAHEESQRLEKLFNEIK